MPNAARLVGRDRPPDLAAKLLELVGIADAELVNRDLGAADLGDREYAEAAENIADAPDAEADDQEPDHRSHDGLADPIGRGFS